MLFFRFLSIMGTRVSIVKSITMAHHTRQFRMETTRRKNMPLERNNILKVMTAIELPSASVNCELSTQIYNKLPLSKIATLGVGLEPVVSAIQQVTSHGQAVSGYYKVTLPPGTHLSQFKNSSDFLGTALANSNNTIAGQAHLPPSCVTPPCCSWRLPCPVLIRNWTPFRKPSRKCWTSSSRRKNPS